MGALLGAVMRSLWKNFSDGLMWMGRAWSGMGPPHEWYEWGEFRFPPSDQPCLPPLTEEELTEWAALVKNLR
ncbi:hypothetical protein AB0N17_40470 [Streptomyces sp. NPDC051133]|uniref:hypothetical protein n=1 Tax=Streptomyces sp. NPDC051133 TaxID=3155521 RepID=UPI003448AF08